MKTSVLFLSALFATTVFATERTDTIADVYQPRQVLITQSDSAINIRVNGSKSNENYLFNYHVSTRGTSLVEEAGSRWDFSLPFMRPQKSKAKKFRRTNGSITMGGFQMGFNHFVGADGNLGNVVGSSFDADLHLLTSHWHFGNHALLIGWDLGWSKYRLDGHNYFNFDGAHVTVTGYPEGTLPGRSVFRLNRHAFNFHYRYLFARNLHLTFGPTVNVHVRPRIYNTYYKDGQTIKEMHKHNIPYNPVTVSLFGAMTYRNLGLYVKYNPAGVFRKDFGPRFQTLTTGVTLFY